MIRFFVPFLVLQLIAVGTSWAREYYLKKDLRAEWLTYTTHQFESFTGEGKSSAIYFYIDTETFKGDHLLIKAPEKCTLFINGKIVTRGKNLLLNLDSLSKNFSAGNLLIGIYYRGPLLENISTAVVTFNRAENLEQPTPVQSSFFRDFVILASLILAGILAVMIRANPKVASDYLSVAKIFSFREVEESKVSSRISSSENLLFYLYCSLIISFFLIIVFYFTSDRYPVAQFFQSHDFGDAWFNWMMLTLIVLAIMFIKIILVFALSYLFGLEDLAGIHFLNLVRVLLVFLGSLTIALFFYYVNRGYESAVHAFFLEILGWLIAGWMILIFLKLSSRKSTPMFHLFSYICATELVPFIIIVKALYN